MVHFIHFSKFLIVNCPNVQLRLFNYDPSLQNKKHVKAIQYIIISHKDNLDTDSLMRLQ
jgi:hypothetical protein